MPQASDIPVLRSAAPLTPARARPCGDAHAVYAIDVSFPAPKDKTEFDYLNRQPTTFVLPDEAVDRLRAAAGTIILASPEFQRLLKDVGARVVADPTPRDSGIAIATSQK